MEVESVAGCGSVARHIVDVHAGEDAHGIEALEGGFLVGQAVAVALEVGDGASPKTGVDGEAFPRVGKTEVVVNHGAFERIVVEVADVDVGAADVPWAARVGLAGGIRLNAELYKSGMRRGVGSKGGDAGGVVIVAVVAHERFDARLFAGEIARVEGIATAEEAFSACGAEEAVGRGVKTAVFDGIEVEELTGTKSIGYLGLLGVAL